MVQFSISVNNAFCHGERVAAIERLFGYSAERTATSFQFELPDQKASWTIGALVGPSGSGKTLAASHAFPTAYRLGPDEPCRWPLDRAIVECFEDRPLESVTAAFGAVGLNSVPAWTRPFHQLSQGERFRAELARALLTETFTEDATERPIIVADEFTSALDRDVAKAACHALARHLRGGSIGARRLVAVTCHQDILPWLDPDWVLNMSNGLLSWRGLRRRNLVFHVHPCHRREWRLFRQHHYLSDAELPTPSECFVVVKAERSAAVAAPAVAFVSLLNAMGMRRTRRISRLVVLPQFQGLGIGRRLAEWAGEHCRKRGLALRINTAHPAMLAALANSPHWLQCRRARSRAHTGYARWTRPRLLGRTLTTFEYAWGGAC